MRWVQGVAALALPAFVVLGPAAGRAVPADPQMGSTFQAEGVPPAPSMTASSPYGSSFRMAPALGGIVIPWAVPTIEGTDLRASLGGADGGTLRHRIVPGDGTIEPDEDDDEDDDRPIRPGTLTTNPVKIPTYDRRLQSRPVAPHLNPDVTYDLNSRTSIGVFSDGTQLDVKSGTALGSVLGLRGKDADSKAGSSVLPGVKAKEIGAGITLQYRFGQ